MHAATAAALGWAHGSYRFERYRSKPRAAAGALLVPPQLADMAHVRHMEAMLIDVCADLGVAAGRVEGRSGVWLPADDRGGERKVAAIGVRVSRGVTMHGFALNCDPDLSWYDRIVPCGIRDASVTSLSAELDRDVTVAEARQLVMDRIDQLLAT